MERDQRRARCEERPGICACTCGEVLPQGDHRKHADDADGDDGGLDDTRGDIAERDALVLPLEDGEQGDGGADVGDGNDDLEERTQGHLCVGAGPADVVGIVQQRAVEKGPGDREHDGDDEQRPVMRRSFS